MSYKDEIRQVLAKMDNEDQQSQDTNPQTSQDAVQDIYVLIVREHEEVEEDQSNVIDSEPPPATSQVDSDTAIPKQQPFECVTLCIVLLCCIPMLASIIFQVYLLQNPPIATVTIIPKSQQVSLAGTLQLGRLLQPITISQSQTVATTGRGHQDAKNATGTVTFFNGLFTQQFIASGTVYTGQDGVEIVTTQDATIPPGNPGSGYGTLTVTAQALLAGSKGNIQAGDIDIAINNGLLVRNSQFYNGQDERNYQTVAKADITNVAITLKSSLDVSMQGALAVQTKQNEALLHPLCSETVSPNHHVGDEANQVTVTVSKTCSAVAYDNHVLATKAAQLLTTQALKKLGSGYSVFGEIHLSVKQPTVTQHPNLVFLSFQAQGTWIYGISQKAQEHIKELIVGKTKQSAMHVLVSLPGVEQVSISWGDDTKLPKDSIYINIKLFVM